MPLDSDIVAYMERLRADIRAELVAYWEWARKDILTRPFGAVPKPPRRQLEDYQAMAGADGPTWKAMMDEKGPGAVVRWHKEMQRLKPKDTSRAEPKEPENA